MKRRTFIKGVVQAGVALMMPVALVPEPAPQFYIIEMTNPNEYALAAAFRAEWARTTFGVPAELLVVTP